MSLETTLPLVIAISGPQQAVREFLDKMAPIDSRLTVENAHQPSRFNQVISLHWRLEGQLGLSDVTLSDLLSCEAAPAYRVTLASATEVEEEADRYIKETGKRRAIARKASGQRRMKF